MNKLSTSAPLPKSNKARDWGLISVSIATFTMGLAICWAVWERHVENDRLYLSPDEEVHRREMQFHQELGYYKREIDEYKEKLSLMEQQLIQINEKIGSASGRVDIMQEYFSKYSPEALIKQVDDMTTKLSVLDEKITRTDIWDARYALKGDLNKYDGLPSEWEWNKLKEQVVKLEVLIKETK